LEWSSIRKLPFDGKLLMKRYPAVEALVVAKCGGHLVLKECKDANCIERVS